MRRAIAVGTLVVAVTGISACKPLAENDGKSSERGIMYKSPSKKPGTIIGESSLRMTLTIKHDDGTVRTYHVSMKQNNFCAIGERWPSCTKPKPKPRPRFPDTEG